MNDKEYLTNKNFCPIPWTGIMYNFDGHIRNCIRSSGPIGNIKENDILEIVNGDKNNITKKNMMNNQPGERCNPCYELEKNKNSFDIISDRIFYLKELKNINKDLYSDSSNFNLHKIDIRWSNLCNFACVYCNSEFSSKWANELNIVPNLPSDEQKEKLKAYVLSNVKQLKHVYLAGGEPLLMKENLELLELLKKENPDTNLRINTNLSKVDTNIFDLICTFKNVHWIISIETIEQEYEYIRYGSKWVDFLDNLKTIQKLNHKVSFNMLHFLLNYQSVFTCIDYLKQLGFHNNSFIAGALTGPVFLNIRHLPNNMLNLVKEELVKRVNEKPGFLLENGYRNILEHINLPIEKNLAESFRQLKLLDERRGLDSTKIFKELYRENNYGKTI